MTQGDPMQPLLWTTRSLRNLVTELVKERHKVCPTVVSELLRGMATACKRTTRHEKAASTSIATRSFNTQHAGHDVPGGERTGHIGRHEEEGIGRQFQEQRPGMASPRQA